MARLTILQHCKRRLDGMKAARAAYEPDAREIASLAAPSRSRFLSTRANKNQRAANKRLLNSHGIFAFRTLQGGMYSGLSSPSRPWFAVGFHDEALNDQAAVREWCGEVEESMYAFLAQTNFYASAKTGYGELGLFGTEACFIVEDPREGAVFHQLTFGEYWIATGANGRPNALGRECVYTALQAVDLFGKDKVSNAVVTAYEAARWDEQFTFFHLIEENPEINDSKADWRGKPWRQVYWQEGEKEPAKVTGFHEQPFWAARWDTAGGDFWGQGPGHDALPDLRELQVQTKRKGEATDNVVHPEIITSSKAQLRRQPKSVVQVSADDLANTVNVPYATPYQAVGLIGEDVQRCMQAIDRASYADLFNAITNMQGIQPRNVEEIASRNEEKMTQLGAVVERVNSEKLSVALDRVFGIMQRGGMLPEPPEEIHGAEIKITFISVLTQMQRIIGLGPIERVMQFAGANMPLFPELRHKFKPIELIDEYAERAGAPAKIMNSNEDAYAAADAETKAAQQAAAVEQAATAAPAVKDIVDAGALASEMPGGGGVSGPDALLPLLQ